LTFYVSVGSNKGRSLSVVVGDQTRDEEPIDVSHFLDFDASTAATNIRRVHATVCGRDVHEGT